MGRRVFGTSQHSSIISHQGSQSRLRKILDDTDNKIDKEFLCPHDEYCNVKGFKDKAHCSLDSAQTCQTYITYQK